MATTATLQNFIGGASAPTTGDGSHEVRNAATGEVIAEMGFSSAADLDAAVEAARAGFKEWREATPSERSLALLKIADELEERGEELAKIETENTGKPLALTISEEIPPAADQIRFMAAAARILEGTASAEYMAGHTSTIRREPIGVCGGITPWNYPFMMAVWKFAPAIAAGNSVILKPSENTPTSTLWLAELINKHVPAGVFNVILGKGDVGEQLVRHEGIDFVSLTGSVRAGKAVAAAAADTLKRVHLELGGKAPVVVFDDADIEAAAEGIAGAGLLQRRPGLHRRDARARRPGRLRRLRRGARRAGEGHRVRQPARRQHVHGPGHQPGPARARRGLHRARAVATRASRPAATRRRTAAGTGSSRRSSRTSSRTTR